MLKQIFEFNEKVIGLQPCAINTLTDKQYDWTVKFCAEELDELEEARTAQDVVGMVDAVIDLCYGALGTLVKMGLTVEQAEKAFGFVHAANMTKVKGMTHRGSDEDAAKPEDFTPPEQAIGEMLFGDPAARP